MSCAEASELIVVFVPPAISTPWNATAYSGTFGEKIANTSPAPKPRAAKPDASARVMPPSCAYVIVRPLGPSISAGLSPNSAACSSTNDGSDVDGMSMSGSTLRNTIDATLVHRRTAVLTALSPTACRGIPPGAHSAPRI